MANFDDFLSNIPYPGQQVLTDQQEQRDQQTLAEQQKQRVCDGLILLSHLGVYALVIHCKTLSDLMRRMMQGSLPLSSITCQPLLPYLLGHYYRSQIFGTVHSCCKEVQTGLQ